MLVAILLVCPFVHSWHFSTKCEYDEEAEDRWLRRHTILIPGGDSGDKRTVAFVVVCLIFKKSCKCGNERLVSHSWCKKMMRAGSCRSTDVTMNYFKNSKETVSAGFFSTGKTSVHLSRNQQGWKFGGIIREFFFRLAASQSPSKIWRAAAAGKIATYRLISRIILASGVNASSRRRRGLQSSTKRIQGLWNRKVNTSFLLVLVWPMVLNQVGNTSKAKIYPNF